MIQVRHFLPLILLASAGCFTSPTQAEGMENIVVTDTLYGDYSLADKLIISHSDIKQLGKKNVADILRTVPGLQVSTQGGIGGPSAVSIRGSEANFVAVYINDVLVNDPSDPRGSGFRFDSVNPLNVERIEIIKGPASASYGANALAGVIRIFTCKPEAWTHQLTLDASPQQGSQKRFHVGRVHGKQAYVLDLGRQRNRYKDSGNDFTGNEINLSVNSNYRDDDQVSAFYRYSDTDSTYYPEQSGGPELAASDKLEQRQTSSRLFSIGSRNHITGNWQSHIRFSQFQHENHTKSPGIAPYTNVPPTEDTTDYQRYTFNWRNRIAVTPWLLAQVGTDHQFESGKSDGTIDMGIPVNADYELKRHNTGIYSNFLLTLPKQWHIQAGIRQDDPEQQDKQTSRQLSFQTPTFYDVVELTLNWGEGFKLPGFSALAHPLVGNPDLKPETVDSTELQLALTLPKAHRITISLFENDYRNLIDFDTALFQNVNRQHVETSGVDLSILLHLFDQLDAELYGNHTRIDTNDSDTTLTGRPEDTAGLQLTWQPADAWQVHGEYRWTGEQYAGTLHTGTTEYVKLSPYALLNLRFNWQVTNSSRLSLAFDNLFDKQYYEAVGTPSPGRAVYLGLDTHW